MDQFAERLKLQRWYEWRPADDAVLPGEPKPEPSVEGPTNVELLKQKESATIMYLLDALQRFEERDDDQVQQIAFEIAMLGRSGSGLCIFREKLHPALPSRANGSRDLHLMALMYVGFKRIQPDMDPGMPFDEAYAIALSLHKGNK